MSNEEFVALAKRRPTKFAQYQKMGRDGFSAEEIDRAVGDVRKTLRRMEDALRDGGSWLMGDQYTITDICIAPLIDRMEDLGYAGLWENDLPSVSDWLTCMQARPAYKTAYYSGSRTSEIFPDLGLGKHTRRPIDLSAFD